MRNLILVILGFLILGDVGAQNGLKISLEPGNVACIGEEVNLTLDYDPALENNGKLMVYLIKPDGSKEILATISPVAFSWIFPSAPNYTGDIYLQHFDSLGVPGEISDTLAFTCLDLQAAISPSCENGVYSLTGKGEENYLNIHGLEYGWVINDTFSKDSLNIVQVDSPGKYVYYIRYDTTNYSCYSADSITISSLPTIQDLLFNNTENSIKCINQDIQQSVSLDSTFYTLNWYFDSNLLIKDEKEVEFKATSSGEKYLVLEVTDTVHQCTVILIDTIQIADNPSVDYAFESLNECDSLLITAIVEPGNFPSGMTITSHSAYLPVQYSPDTVEFDQNNKQLLSGPYNLFDAIWVKYDLVNSSGCVVSDSLSLNVPQFDPRCKITPVISSDKVCVGDSMGIELEFDFCPREYSYVLNYTNDTKTIAITDYGMVSDIINGVDTVFRITKFMKEVRILIEVSDGVNLVCADSATIALNVSEYPENPGFKDTLDCPGTSLTYTAPVSSLDPYWEVGSGTLTGTSLPIIVPEGSTQVVYGDSSKHCVTRDTFFVRGFKKIEPEVTQVDDCLPLLRIDNPDSLESWEWQFENTIFLFAINEDSSEFILGGPMEKLEMTYVDKNGCLGEYLYTDALTEVSLLAEDTAKILYYSCGELTSLIALDSVACFTWGRIDKLSKAIEYPIDGPDNQYLFPSTPDTVNYTYFAVEYDCLTKECGDYFVFRQWDTPFDPCPERKDVSYSLYPNPSFGSSYVEIKHPKGGIHTFRLRDVYARLVLEISVDIQEGSDIATVPLELDGSSWNEGFYFLECLVGADRIATLPLIIIKQ